MDRLRRREIIVPCEGAGHRVRLRGGLRLLARARCPTCRRPVDPLRWRRLLAIAANLRRPVTGSRLDVALWALSLAAPVLTVVVASLFWLLADRWWPATLLLFGPRWVFLVPIVPLGLVAAVRDRALLLPLAFSAWVVLGPIMGMRTGWRALLTFDDPDRDIVVATFNVLGGDVLQVGPLGLMESWGADIAAFQECGNRMQREIQGMYVPEIESFYTWTGETLCLISRFPILETRVMPADVIQSAGGSGLVAAHLLETEEGRVLLTNVHLETPRDGLALIRRGRLAEGIDVLKRDAYMRGVEHRQTANFALSPGSHIVVGDFNSPPESRIYRTEWGRTTNTFSVAGFGIGGSRLNGSIRSRIDHILVSDDWKVVDAWMGEDVGSDHRPMLARIRRR